MGEGPARDPCREGLGILGAFPLVLASAATQVLPSSSLADESAWGKFAVSHLQPVRKAIRGHGQSTPMATLDHEGLGKFPPAKSKTDMAMVAHQFDHGHAPISLNPLRYSEIMTEAFTAAVVRTRSTPHHPRCPPNQWQP